MTHSTHAPFSVFSWIFSLIAFLTLFISLVFKPFCKLERQRCSLVARARHRGLGVLSVIYVVFSGLGSAVVAPTVLAEDTPAAMQQTFKDVDINQVIEGVAKITGRNFIIDPRVKGKVTLIAPAPMPPEALYETLLSVLRVHGYVAIEGENTTRVVPANVARDQVRYNRPDRVDGENWVTEVLKVEHVSASKLVSIIRPLVAREGHLVAMQDTNRLIATDTRANLKRIREILTRVDRPNQGAYEVVALEHASAEALMPTLERLVSESANGDPLKLQFEPRTNRLILAGTKAQRLRMRALIAELDVPVPSDGRVDVVYLRYAKAEDLAPVLQAMATNRSMLNSELSDVAEATTASTQQKGSAKQAQESLEKMDAQELQDRISIEPDQRTNALVISAPPPILEGLKSVIKALDIRRAQVLIEAILVEVSESRQAELGVEWAANGPNGVGLIDFSGSLPAIISGAVSGSASQVGQALSQQQGATAAVGQLEANNRGWGALIRALNSDTGSNVLATPTLLTLDNEEAEIIVGKEVPFQTGSYTTNNSGASNPFTTVERKEVGLKLKLKPQINEGSEVFLEIDQEVSSVLPADGAVDLQTSKRQIKTKIIVGDGNMVVLGGLLDERETEVTKKLPGLGDLPGVGALFRSQQTQREKVNLMIFLRAVIVKDAVDAGYYSRKKYHRLRQDQTQVLKNESDLIPGQTLRPRMPSLENWQQGQPAEPYAPDEPEKAPESEFDTYESEYEQLGL